MNRENVEYLMVTIRCTAYNHGPYIRQCLEGFVMQKTTFRFEAVVHDDASTDNTAAIIKEYSIQILLSLFMKQRINIRKKMEL